MRIKINAADLERYNANNRGSNVGDCVKRGISLAFDVPYYKIGQMLNDKMKELNRSKWNILPVYGEIVKELGGGELYNYSKMNTTVNEFADQHEHDPYIYLVLCGKADNGRHSHMTCIRDGKIWDSWDCRDWYVSDFWRIDPSNRPKLRQTSDNFIYELAQSIVIPLAEDEIQKYAKKRGWHIISIYPYEKTNKYQIVCEFGLILNLTEAIPKKREYEFKINITIEPRLSEQEAIEFVKKMTKTRVYDRMWAINEQEKKLAESYKMELELTGKGATSKSTLLKYMTNQERKFYNSLPGWAIPLVIDLRIDSPGQYHNSYRLNLRRLPKDKLHDDYAFTFEAYNADDLRDMLDGYYAEYLVPGIDYYFY